ncbi:hypothetical protein SAMN06265365_13840 [Tistlia consotensis]|uniref:VanZ like family protein n=1 Tax=Tistlia consotensis USBA 355 TaxID=560819 RepID=A0A1Y6CMV6_9PROT|nr:hypothetical protein [Tistlia consotensis]SMF77618.1 hypothetical protein SAMN05428998_13723 [Tistlia consotensis USBA 355]SNS21018.1 hypothetical protein SAMN06265365_13840 [Tistlia consotensis]
MLERALQLGFWLALAAVTLLALMPQPPQVVPLDSDKAQHALAFAVLSLGLAFAYRRLSFPWMLLALAAYGGAIELAQLIPALHRDSDLMDWLTDLAAIAVVLPAAVLLRRRLPLPATNRNRSR